MRRLATLTLLALTLSVGSSALPAHADDGNLVSTFSIDLTGSEEAPGPGDPNGSGFAHVIVLPTIGLLCYVIYVQDITLPATGAHIHVAPRGEPGPIVVPLANPNASGFSGGCLRDVSPALLQAIHENPENYYVNVHSTEHLPGAVRGQLA